MNESMPPEDAISPALILRPSPSNRPEAGSAKKVRPGCCRLLKNLIHVEDSAVREHSQIEVCVASCFIRMRQKLQHMNRMCGEHIWKSFAPRVFEGITNRPADRERTMPFNHSAAEQLRQTCFVTSDCGVDCNTQVPCNFRDQLASIIEYPSPEPITYVPRGNCCIDGAIGPELRLSVQQTRAIKLINLKLQLRNQIAPRLQMKCLPTVGNWLSGNGHFQHLECELAKMVLTPASLLTGIDHA